MRIDVHVVLLDAPPRSGCVDAVARALLARELGRAIELRIGEHGKPAVVGGEIAFNIAHSGELALIAIGRGEVGVDLEEIDARRDVVAIARRFFAPAEAALVATDPTCFWRLWCRKEAWLKARGTGLVFPIDVDVSGDVPGWALANLAIAPGYAAAVACGGDAIDVRVHAARSGSAIIARSTAT